MAQGVTLCVGVSPSMDVTLRVAGLDRDRVNRVTGERREAGGKALNVARELCRLGKPCRLLSLLGESGADEYLAAAASGCAADMRAVRYDGRVRENLTILTGDGGTVKINRPGDSYDPALSARLTSETSALTSPGGVAVFSGSVPPGMTSGQYIELMNTAADRGARLAVDTCALTRGELTALRPWLIKPNEHELCELCGQPPESEADTERLMALAGELVCEGVGIVLLTLGGRGLAAVTADGTVRVTARPATVRNTVGAGDSALAGFIAAWTEGRSLRECADSAAESGARAVEREGTA